MDIQKIVFINGRINKNRQKLMKETDPKKRDVLRLKIGIDGYKVKLERLKDEIKNRKVLK